MSGLAAHVALLVDFDALGAAAAPAGDLATALLRYAAGVGRVTLARGYADWSARPDDLRAVQAARLAPVLAPRGPRGEDRAHVRLVVDALEALYAGGEPDAFVLAGADGRLLPLVHALRADGCDVLVVAPASAAVDDVRAEADASATLEEVLAGAVGRPSTPRPAEEEPEEEGEEEAEPPSPRAPLPPRERAAGRGGGPRDRDEGRGPGRGFGGPRGGGRFAPQEIDFTSYDWSSFVRLIDELEHRLPFVGVRYLVNKVLGPRNCGVDDPRLKRDLINRAVDEGILEMHEVGNVGDRADPVTACRLDRENAVVIQVLGAGTKTPLVPEHRSAEPPVGGFVEGGLPLDADADEGD